MPEIEERIAVLEIQQKNIELKLAEMAEKVDEVHSLLLQAKGAKWAIIGLASLGGFVAGKLGGVFSFLTVKP